MPKRVGGSYRRKKARELANNQAETPYVGKTTKVRGDVISGSMSEKSVLREGRVFMHEDDMQKFLHIEAERLASEYGFDEEYLMKRFEDFWQAITDEVVRQAQLNNVEEFQGVHSPVDVANEFRIVSLQTIREYEEKYGNAVFEKHISIDMQNPVDWLESPNDYKPKKFQYVLVSRDGDVGFPDELDSFMGDLLDRENGLPPEQVAYWKADRQAEENDYDSRIRLEHNGVPGPLRNSDDGDRPRRVRIAEETGKNITEGWNGHVMPESVADDFSGQTDDAWSKYAQMSELKGLNEIDNWEIPITVIVDGQQQRKTADLLDAFEIHINNDDTINLVFSDTVAVANINDLPSDHWLKDIGFVEVVQDGHRVWLREEAFNRMLDEEERDMRRRTRRVKYHGSNRYGL